MQPFAEGKSLATLSEDTLQRKDQEIKSLRLQLFNEEQGRQQEQKDMEAMMAVLVSQESELESLKAMLREWDGHVVRALQSVEDMHSELVCAGCTPDCFE